MMLYNCITHSDSINTSVQIENDGKCKVTSFEGSVEIFIHTLNSSESEAREELIKKLEKLKLKIDEHIISLRSKL